MEEKLFISVNKDSVDLNTALNILRAIDDSFLNNIKEMIVIRQYARDNGLYISDEELQKAVDEYRYNMGLESAQAFKQYLNARKLSLFSFQTAIENLLLKNKAVNCIPDEEVDAYIAENMLNMEQAELYNIVLDDEDTAREIKFLLDEEENFLAMANKYSRDKKTAITGGYMGKLGRRQMNAELEAAVFSASKGDIIGPVKTEQTYSIFKVAGFSRPDKFNNELRKSVKCRIFNKKMAQMTALAEVNCSLYEGCDFQMKH